jgi:hypothetical protein
MGYSGNGGPATNAMLNQPCGVTIANNIYITDTMNNVIRMVFPNGTIITVAGNGAMGYSGDGGPATKAMLNNPYGVSVSAAGDLYIADSSNNVIRKVFINGTINTIAGNGTKGYFGSDVPAQMAMFDCPWRVPISPTGEIYTADASNNRIRMLSCDPGYTGYSCSLYTCHGTNETSPNVCSGHGNCTNPNTCTCNIGYSGSECEKNMASSFMVNIGFPMLLIIALWIVF